MPQILTEGIPDPVLAKQAYRANEEVKAELVRAMQKHAPMRGPHEGYAVILEELDELWDEVKKKRPDRVALREEAAQIAAMALRFMVDVAPE